MKYSIIIPTHNAIKFLPNCINTIINQDYEDYELIVSDDSSTDGTTEYLNNIVSKNIKIVHPKKRLNMVEHFEWTLQFATGEWVMFLGSDDGLQSYFFELADILTDKADKKSIRAIMSERAYYFWRGCESLYGKTAIGYRSRKEIKVLNSKREAFFALIGLQTYFELPEMYTTSLFKKSLVDEAVKIQNGKLFSTVPPDANLGAIAISLEKNYLKSFIPLGWVGTSSDRTSPVLMLPDNGILCDGIVYERNAGHYHIGANSLYFWNALLRSENLRKTRTNKILKSKLLKTIIFAGVLAEIRRKKYLDAKKRLGFLDEAININKLNKAIVKNLSYLMNIIFYSFKYYKSLINKLKFILFPSYKINVNWDDKNDISMNEESIKLKEALRNENII